MQYLYMTVLHMIAENEPACSLTGVGEESEGEQHPACDFQPSPPGHATF